MKKGIQLTIVLFLAASFLASGQIVQVTDKNSKEEGQVFFSLGNKSIELNEEGDIISVDRKSDNTAFSLTSAEDRFFNLLQEEPERKRRRRVYFDPTWDGIGIGFNGYLTSDNSLSLPAAYQYMDLNTSRSWSVHARFGEIGVPLGTDMLGLVSGLGVEFNSYFFDGNNSITTDATGVVQPLIFVDEVVKSKLSTVFVQIPLLMEIQLPVRYERIRITGGIMGAVKVASHTKVKYDNDSDQKVKNKDDFSLSTLRYGAVASVGYGSVSVFANYSLVSLFEKDKGPELYPFSIGLTFTFD